MKVEAINNLVFPVAVVGLLLLIISLHYIPLPLGFLAIGLMTASIASLVYARFPPYKKKQFFKIGPEDLDQKHRKWYYVSYACLIIAVFISVLIVLKYNH